MIERLYLPWRAVQREWGYPDYEGGPEVRLWEVHDARGACVVILTIHCRSKEAAELIAAAINVTAGGSAPTVHCDPEHDDPTLWCNGCGARAQDDCDCGPIASND